MSQLESILRESKLHFHRLDDFADPFEGSVPETVAKRRSEYAENRSMEELDEAINKRVAKG